MKKIYPFIALLILASNLNLLSKNNKFLQVLPNIGVTCFEIDRNNCKWVGTALKGLIKYDGKDTISYNLSNTIMQTNEIDCLYLNDNDDIWIGTKKGLYVFDRKNNWRWYHTTNSGLPGIQIMSIIKDRNGYFWIGTNLENIS